MVPLSGNIFIQRIVSVVFGKVSRATILIYLQQRITLWKG